MNDKSTKNECKLNKTQRQLCEQNQSFIYDYAVKNNLDIEEYYGILAIGLCKAAKAYDSTKSRFSTFAYACMKNEVLMHLRSANRKSNVPATSIVCLDEESNLEEIPNRDYQNFEECVIMLAALRENLTETQNAILNLMLQGEKQEKISEIVGCKIENVWYNIRQIRKKASQLER